MRAGRLSIALSSAGAVWLAAFALARAEDATVDAPRPNFVVFLVDDLRFDMLGFAGHSFIETPHIDRLANEGATFTNAFVTTSLCCPSRASLLTGLYAHQHGVTTNLGIDLNPGVTTFPQVLQAAGWDTAFIGKWHMGEGAHPRPGFDHWVSFDGQGRYFDPVLRENDVDAEVKGYVTDLLTDRAVSWLESREGSDPFCLFLSHKATHTPMAPAARHRGRFADIDIPAPTAALDDLVGKPEILRRSAAHGFKTIEIEQHANEPVPDRVPPPDWEQRDFVQAYLETTMSVDDSLGRVLEALEKHELTDNTIVLFASDNGYVFGEHQAPDKRLAWEASIHVPFLVWAPGRVEPNTQVDDIVLNIDVAPALLQWAGIEDVPSMSGRSFAPLIDASLSNDGDAPEAWRSEFFYSYFQENRLAGIPTTLAVRSAEWKYVCYPDSLPPNEELYRIDRDPDETTNLAADASVAEELGAMRSKLERAKSESSYAVPRHAQPPAFEALDPPQSTAISLEGNLQLPAGAMIRQAFALRVATRAIDGRVLNGGRQKNGFELSIDEGRPVFVLTAKSRTRRVVGPALEAGKPVQVEAGLALDGRAFVRVGEQVVWAALAMNAAVASGDALSLGPTHELLVESIEWVVTGRSKDAP